MYKRIHGKGSKAWRKTSRNGVYLWFTCWLVLPLQCVLVSSSARSGYGPKTLDDSKQTANWGRSVQSIHEEVGTGGQFSTWVWRARTDRQLTTSSTSAHYIDHHPKRASSKLGHWPEHGSNRLSWQYETMKEEEAYQECATRWLYRPREGHIVGRAGWDSRNSVLPRPFLQGAAPCPFLVTPWNDALPFWLKHMAFSSVLPSYCPHTAWIVLCLLYCAIQGHFWFNSALFFRSPC